MSIILCIPGVFGQVGLTKASNMRVCASKCYWQHCRIDRTTSDGMDTAGMEGY